MRAPLWYYIFIYHHIHELDNQKRTDSLLCEKLWEDEQKVLTDTILLI